MTAAESISPVVVSRAVPVFSKGYRAWLLTVLLVINALNLADRQGIAAVAPALKVALKLSDTELGLLQGLGFAIFYTLLGLPMARMAERLSRAKIIAISVAVFGIMVSLCGAAQSFLQLLLARVGVGVGDAGFGPPVASLIGDHYPREKRASAMSIIWLGAPVGAVTGAVMGGWMAEHVSWRAAFFAVGAPGLLFALIAFFTLREPPRGMSDPAQAQVTAPPSILAVLRFLFAKPSFRHVLIGGGLAAMGMNGLGQFLGRFLVANFHLGFADAGRMLGTISGVSMASGLALGGFGVDWAGKFDRRWYVWGPAVGLVLATPLFLLGVTRTGVLPTILVLISAHIVLFVYYTPTLAMAQNMVGASMRASSAFVVSLVLGLVGIGLGPTAIGILSDLFAQHAFALGSFHDACPGGTPPTGAEPALFDACRDASAAGIRHAIMAVSLLFCWASLHYVLAARHLRQDLDTHYQGG